MKITMRGDKSKKGSTKVLLDANILFEMATRYDDSSTTVHSLYNLLVEGKVTGYSSPVSIAALFSLLRRCMSEQQARDSLNTMHSLVTIAETDSLIIDLSLASRFDRFDDAIQYYTAIRHNISTVISRTTPEHSYHHLQIVSPEEFINEYSEEQEDIWSITRKQLEQARVVL